MFLAAGASFVLYMLLFLKLRGHISSDLRFSFRARPLGADMSRVAGQMLWYPMVYAVLVFPIAGCRIYEIKTFMMSNLEVKMGSAVFFMLFGLMNVILYTLTRNVIPLPRFIHKLLGLSSTVPDADSTSPGDSEKSGFRRMSTRHEDDDDHIISGKGGGGKKNADRFPSNSSSPSMPVFAQGPQSFFSSSTASKRGKESRRWQEEGEVPVPAVAVLKGERGGGGGELLRTNSVESTSSSSTRSFPMSISEKMAMAVEYTTPLVQVPERSYLRPTSPKGSVKSGNGNGNGGSEGAGDGLKKSSSVLSSMSSRSFGSSGSRSGSPTNSSKLTKNGRAVLQKPNPAAAASLSPFD
ncbi:hypothetical protein FRC17_005317 [Serendipita sp. 399]|nr:hypothetical protein FRC17_005317 [Serendipita sp. 399]